MRDWRFGPERRARAGRSDSRTSRRAPADARRRNPLDPGTPLDPAAKERNVSVLRGHFLEQGELVRVDADHLLRTHCDEFALEVRAEPVVVLSP